VPFEESLVEIQNDDNIRELMALCERHPHVDLFVKHTNAYDMMINIMWKMLKMSVNLRTTFLRMNLMTQIHLMMSLVSDDDDDDE